MNPNDIQFKLSIIIPAYNEASRIGSTLESLSAYLNRQAYTSEVIVVLNNCTDTTKDIVNGFQKKIKSLTVLEVSFPEYVGNTKGYAIRRGMEEACGEYVLFMDADNATDIKEIEKLLPYMEENDVVIGSRYVKDSHVVISQPLYRRILSRIGNMLIRILILPGIYDTQCGFKLFSQKASKAIAREVTVHGWGVDIEMLAIAKKYNYRIAEVGIVWEDKTRGVVKASAFLHTFRELLGIWWRNR